MKNSIKSNAGYFVAGSVLLGSLLLGSTAFAAGSGFGHGGRVPGVFGTVSAVSGNTITVTSKGFGQNATPTTYTVDATNATITKGSAAGATPATITISGITVGDIIMVQGTLSGSNVTATTIRDGVGMMGRGRMGMKPGQYASTTAPVIKGNGQPVIGGNVTAINGNSLTVTNTSNVTYTVDVTNATVEKDNTASTVASIAVGDNIVVQGTVNGTSVTASSVMDSGANITVTNSTTGANPHQGGIGGIFGGIGGFFHHLFGFF